MTPIQWKKINNFTPEESWGDPMAMDIELVRELDALRAYTGRRIVIHCGYEAREGKGYHPRGQAADIHIEDLSLMDAFLSASRFKRFRGIGVYPWWNSPGLHVDTRFLNHGEPRALWASTGPLEYRPFDLEFINYMMLNP